MKKHTRSIFILILALISLNACMEREDPGPLQEVRRDYDFKDFTAVEVGHAIVVNVTQGEMFEISVRGDRRNLEDLRVRKDGTRLEIGFWSWERRQHTTYVDIIMPSLDYVGLSGASVGFIYGFDNPGTMVLNVSGASLCDLHVTAEAVHAAISGASLVRAWGGAESLDVSLSGASLIHSFPFTVTYAEVMASGASNAEISVVESLEAVATGASEIVYRGDPAVTVELSSDSIIRPE